MNKTDLNKILMRMADLHVVVVGDVMLDNYWWGHAERISPEAPVPVVALPDVRAGWAEQRTWRSTAAHSAQR
jgi:bifunctional ADP-heptose synthase (sugar kinase/adenylyltransferase)